MERAVLFHGPGLPLEVKRFSVPELSGSEILARVACCTLCGSDLHTHAGRRLVDAPTVLGHEIVGRIEAFGPEAVRHDFRGADLAIGTRISWSVAASCGECFYCANGLQQKCTGLFKYGHWKFDATHPFSGGLADLVTLVPGSAIFRVPDDLVDAVVASASCATATAAAVIRAGGDVAGQRVLIFGAGMLGLTACAVVQSAGAAEIIVSDPDPKRRNQARAFGASVICSADARELAVAVAGTTFGRGADVALELAGVADAVNAGLNLTRVGGTLILAGTVLPTPSVALDPEQVVRRMLTIRGVHNYAPSDLGAAIDFLAGPGKQYPFSELIQRTFNLDDVELAFQFAHNERGARVAIVP
jgi:putative phosphonate catabolism associated alcohol dehydrogenase